MIQKDWIVCDLTGIIVNDGVTLFPNYVEIIDGIKYTYTTDDPRNEFRHHTPWQLHNRVEHKIVTQEPCDEPLLQGKHFVSEKAMKEYLTRIKE